MVVIAYPYHSDDLEQLNPPLIQDLIELEATGHQACVSQIINMIADLKTNGGDSRYLKNMSGPFLELKTASRGGDKGGARVYLFQTAPETFYLCHAECKKASEASAVLLFQTLEIIKAHRNGQPILKKRAEP